MLQHHTHVSTVSRMYFIIALYMCVRMHVHTRYCVYSVLIFSYFSFCACAGTTDCVFYIYHCSRRFQHQYKNTFFDMKYNFALRRVVDKLTCQQVLIRKGLSESSSPEACIDSTLWDTETREIFHKSHRLYFSYLQRDVLLSSEQQRLISLKL